MRLRYRLQGGNSGIQFRSRELPHWDTSGYQADMDASDYYTGSLYEEARGTLTFRGKKLVIDPDGKRHVRDGAGGGGDVWRIDGLKHTNLVADLGVDLEGVTTTPNDPAKYGPFAGKILVGEESPDPGIYAIDANNGASKWLVQAYVNGATDLTTLQPENLAVVPSGQSLFCVDHFNETVVEVPEGALEGFQGDLLVTDEYGGLFLLHWNGYDFEARQVAPVKSGCCWPEVVYEQATFAPITIHN